MLAFDHSIDSVRRERNRLIPKFPRHGVAGAGVHVYSNQIQVTEESPKAPVITEEATPW
jgi:hypothetical protein